MTDSNESPPISVWTYGGYQLEGSTFATALVHLYRAEITRANAWRNRLDVTTNWAVITTAAAISFGFAQPETHHSVIILITVLVTLFLAIEARRYQYYELWSYRARLIETDFYAAMLVPPFRPRADWSKNLAESLLHPQFPISMSEAFGRRLRRNYIWIYLVLAAAWISKLVLYPEGIETVGELIRRSSMGALSGRVVMIIMFSFYAAIIVTAIVTYRLQKATGEVLHRQAEEIANLSEKQRETKKDDVPVVP
jgi:uncharacterized membrane protein